MHEPPPNRSLSQRVEDGYLTAVLLLVFSWLIPLAYSQSSGSISFDVETSVTVGARALTLQEGTPLFQWAIGTCYIISGLVLLRRVRPQHLPMAMLLPIGVVILAAVSLLWSESPAITLRRLVGLIGTSVLAMHLGWCCDWPRLARLLGLAAGIACGTSLAASLLFPEWAAHHGGDHDGDWRGLFIQKNVAGTAMVVGLLAAFANAGTAWPSRWRWSAVLGLIAVIGIVMSGSRTAWFLATCVSLTAAWLALARHRRVAAQVVTIVGVAALLAVAVTVFDIFHSAERPEQITLLGRDMTATGRYTLWNTLAPYIADRPLAGYGFRGFWSGSGPSLEVWNATGWEPANGHSSWVDTLLELGLLGVAMVLALVASSVLLLWSRWRVLAVGQAIWSLGIVGMLTLQGLSDTTLLEPNGLLWTAFLVSFFHLLRSAQTEPA